MVQSIAGGRGNWWGAGNRERRIGPLPTVSASARANEAKASERHLVSRMLQKLPVVARANSKLARRSIDRLQNKLAAMLLSQVTAQAGIETSRHKQTDICTQTRHRHICARRDIKLPPLVLNNFEKVAGKYANSSENETAGVYSCKPLENNLLQ